MSSGAGGVLYLDSSAVMKLAVSESETAALAAELVRWPICATSSITAVEVTRATVRAQLQQRAVRPASDVRALLAKTWQVGVTDLLRRAASTLAPAELRALDAIHVASALALGDALAAVVTYDVRMQDAAERRRLRVLAPR